MVDQSDPDDNFDNYMGGKPDPDSQEDDEAIAARRKRAREEERLNAEQKAEEEEEAARARADKPEAGSQDQDHKGARRSKLGAINHFFLGVKQIAGADGQNEYIGVSGKRDPQRAGQRHVTDRQLQAMIIRGVLENGWKELYFYKGRHTIDQALTDRANAMIATKLSQPGMPLYGLNVRASKSRMDDLEPWNNKGLTSYFHSAVHNYHDFADNLRAKTHHTKMTTVNGFKMWATYNNAAQRGEKPKGASGAEKTADAKADAEAEAGASAGADGTKAGADDNASKAPGDDASAAPDDVSKEDPAVARTGYKRAHGGPAGGMAG